jgi:hypothetical protein
MSRLEPLALEEVEGLEAVNETYQRTLGDQGPMPGKHAAPEAAQ